MRRTISKDREKRRIEWREWIYVSTTKEKPHMAENKKFKEVKTARY